MDVLGLPRREMPHWARSFVLPTLIFVWSALMLVTIERASEERAVPDVYLSTFRTSAYASSVGFMVMVYIYVVRALVGVVNQESTTGSSTVVTVLRGHITWFCLPLYYLLCISATLAHVNGVLRVLLDGEGAMLKEISTLYWFPSIVSSIAPDTFGI